MSEVVCKLSIRMATMWISQPLSSPTKNITLKLLTFIGEQVNYLNNLGLLEFVRAFATVHINGVVGYRFWSRFFVG